MPASSTTTAHCPYAVALQDDASTSDHSADERDDLMITAVKSCPAFEEGQCPFKDTQKVKETLAKIPPSHFEPTGKFYQVVRGLHEMQAQIQENTDSHYHLPGGCPVQPAMQREYVSFTQAMESWSLAAIMARLAKEQGLVEDESDHGDEQDIVEGLAPTVAVAPVAVAPVAVSSTRPSLARALKVGTAVSHQAAEDVHFVSNFIQGKIDRELYGKLVVMLYHVYDKLEACLDQAGPVHFPTLHFPVELGRTATLEEDMDFWHGGMVHEKSPAVQDYIDRLEYLTTHDPLLLLAHSYTRYLGDLSGGKILARVARRALVLQADGLAFYEFANIASPKLFKDMYRNAMDEMPLTEEQVVKLVAEANVSFLLNMRLFEELDVIANVPGASVRPLKEVMDYANGNVAAVALSEKEAECPFLVGKQDKKGAATPSAGGSAKVVEGAKRCPWPFILMHDPMEGLRDWQTWAALGLLLCGVWTLVVNRTAVQS